MEPVITADNLNKTFTSRGNHRLIAGLFKPNWQHKTAVNNVTFTIDQGESVAFLGPNGAGKTTTTKMLTGLVYPTSGSVRVLGYTPFDRHYKFLKKIGLVMGNKAGLNWDLSARQSFMLLEKIYDIPPEVARARIKELCTLLRVEHVLDTQVRRLSLGERMKLEVIGAILHDPDILFLDEPTIGLDIHAKKNIREFLRHLHKNGKTLLLTSHDMDDISEVCDRVLVINHGELMFDNSMAALVKNYTDMRYARLEFSDKAPTRDYLEKCGTVVALNEGTATIGVERAKVMDIAGEIAKKFPLQDITIEQVPLEVIISDLYSRDPSSSEV